MMTAPPGKAVIIILWDGRREITRRQVASRGASFIVKIMIRALKAGHAIEVAEYV